MSNTMELFGDIQVLPRGRYLQLVVKVTLLDDAIIRSNEPEEVLTFNYKSLGNRFIIPWRKIKGKLRRLVMEKQRDLGIPNNSNCYLKDHLCMTCPACLLFGGTGETSATKADYNLLSRVLGETFISRTEVKDISAYTANAVDEETLTTGQALMTILKVPTETEFSGVVTLRDPTPELTSILIDNLNRLTRLGASTREWGKVKTEIVGYVLSDRETLSSYDLVKSEKKDDLCKIADLNLPTVEDSFKKVAELIPHILPKKKQEKGKRGSKAKEETTEAGEESAEG
ncbi:MAG: type I-D CRISPR-associated protein Cas7/Csc2 [Candidatus Jordarchaeum sp.]|uniref:type I-D CRISPR-associated protein Cas7/Csc2 n=1 Tax=Candidatus Jordarchaeum sp. TaxID=2823881 RepID=UPI00404ADB5E